MLRPTPPPYSFLPVPLDHIMARMQLLPVKIPGSDWAFYAFRGQKMQSETSIRMSRGTGLLRVATQKRSRPFLKTFATVFPPRGGGGCHPTKVFLIFFSKTIKHQHLKLSVAICLSLARILR